MYPTFLFLSMGVGFHQLIHLNIFKILIFQAFAILQCVFSLLKSEKALVIILDYPESNMILVKSTPLDKNKDYTIDLEQFLWKFYELQKWKCQHYFYIVNQSKLIEVF